MQSEKRQEAIPKAVKRIPGKLLSGDFYLAHRLIPKISGKPLRYLQSVSERLFLLLLQTCFR